MVFDFMDNALCDIAFSESHKGGGRLDWNTAY
jgi:hypothetical protein